jgi:hypothetical protein
MKSKWSMGILVRRKRQVERVVGALLGSASQQGRRMRSGAACGGPASAVPALGGLCGLPAIGRDRHALPGPGLQIGLLPQAASASRQRSRRQDGASGTIHSRPSATRASATRSRLPVPARFRHGWRAPRPKPRPRARQRPARRSARRWPAGRPAATASSATPRLSASFTAAPVMWCASRKGMFGLAHQPVGQIGGRGIAQLRRAAHARRAERRAPPCRSSPRWTGRAGDAASNTGGLSSCMSFE